MPKAAKKVVERRKNTPYDIIQPDVSESGGIQIVSYSELDTFRQCPLKHHLLYQRRWTKGVKLGSALDKGSLWHLVMEDHYGVIKAWQDRNRRRMSAIAERKVLEVAYKLVHQRLHDPDTGEYYSEVHELIMWMYEGYIEMYGADVNWRITGIEHQIKVPLLNAKGEASRYVLKAKLDLIIREWDSGNLWIIDHKSGANLPTQMDLEIDDQFGLYTWLMRRIGKPVMGSLHSAARTTRNVGDWPNATKGKAQTLEQRMSRTYLNRGEMELTNLALDAYYAAKAAYPDDPAYAARYSSPDPRSCGWKCDVKEPHLVMRSGANPDKVMIDYGFKVDRTRH